MLFCYTCVPYVSKPRKYKIQWGCCLSKNLFHYSSTRACPFVLVDDVLPSPNTGTNNRSRTCINAKLIFNSALFIWHQTEHLEQRNWDTPWILLLLVGHKIIVIKLFHRVVVVVLLSDQHNNVNRWHMNFGERPPLKSLLSRDRVELSVLVDFNWSDEGKRDCFRRI